jgi:hypothetical protein
MSARSVEPLCCARNCHRGGPLALIPQTGRITIAPLLGHCPCGSPPARMQWVILWAKRRLWGYYYSMGGGWQIADTVGYPPEGCQGTTSSGLGSFAPPSVVVTRSAHAHPGKKSAIL